MTAVEFKHFHVFLQKSGYPMASNSATASDIHIVCETVFHCWAPQQHQNLMLSN